jgi:hypothetical protein
MVCTTKITELSWSSGSFSFGLSGWSVKSTYIRISIYKITSFFSFTYLHQGCRLSLWYCVHLQTSKQGIVYYIDNKLRECGESDEELRNVVKRGRKRGGKKGRRETCNIVDFAKYHSILAAATNSIGEFIVVVDGLRAPHVSQ